MSKPKKQKPKGLESPKLLTTEALEQKTALDLDQHNYRRAKEWLKELCKRNKDLYQPRLIACYQSLARQMLEKGQRNEAETVFEQIRLLTGRPVDRRLEAQSLTLADDYRAAATAAAGVLGEKGGEPLTEAKGKALADNLVLAFEDIPELQENHPELHRELLSVRAALEHLSAERFAEAQNVIKAIGRNSLFADWRLFIKGLCAFYAGDDAKASEALQRFDGDSLLSRAARPFINIINDGAQLPKTEAKEPLLTDICRILRQPGLEHVLPRAEYLWLTGRHVDSLEHALRMLSGFPTNEPGLLHALSRFYFQTHLHMSRDHGNKYLRDLYYVIRKRPHNDVLNLHYARAAIIFFENSSALTDQETLKAWEDFLALQQRVSGENDRLRAHVYAHLGDLFAMDDDDQPAESWFVRRRKKKKVSMRNPRLARESYEKSLAFCLADKDFHIKLLTFYEKIGDNGSRNRKLDEMSRLFADDRDVLAKNGNYCIERKAYLKGIEYLKRALALDPLARANREALGVACIKASLHFARQKTPLRYREFMKEAMELGEAEPTNMTLGRRYLLIRQAIFEWIGGEEREGNLLLAEALKNGNEGGRLSYFASMIGKVYDAPPPLLSRLEDAVRPVFATPSPAGISALVDVFQYIKLVAADNWWLNKESRRLTASALKAADQPCSPEDAENIIRYAIRERPRNPGLIYQYAQNILRDDPKSPLFLYFLHLHGKISSGYSPPTRNDLQRLKDIQEIAVERNQRLLVNMLAQEIRTIEEFLSSPRADTQDNEEDFDNVEDNIKAAIERIAKEMEELSGFPGGSSAQRKKKKASASRAALVDEPELPF